MTARPFLALVGTLIAAVVATLGVFALSSSHRASGAEPGVNSSLLTSFSILSDTSSTATPSSAADLPVRMARLEPGVTGEYALDFAAAKQVQSGSVTVTVVPGQTGLCILAAETVTSGRAAGVTASVSQCAATATVLAKGLQAALYNANTATGTDSGMIASLVPDGNNAVDVTAGGATVETPPVADNVAVAELTQAALSKGNITVTLDSASGAPASYTADPPAAVQ
jgi:hypothetical protein